MAGGTIQINCSDDPLAYGRKAIFPTGSSSLSTWRVDSVLGLVLVFVNKPCDSWRFPPPPHCSNSYNVKLHKFDLIKIAYQTYIQKVGNVEFSHTPSLWSFFIFFFPWIFTDASQSLLLGKYVMKVVAPSRITCNKTWGSIYLDF